jgi:hypothetical protein
MFFYLFGDNSSSCKTFLRILSICSSNVGKRSVGGHYYNCFFILCLHNKSHPHYIDTRSFSNGLVTKSRHSWNGKVGDILTYSAKIIFGGVIISPLIHLVLICCSTQVGSQQIWGRPEAFCSHSFFIDAGLFVSCCQALTLLCPLPLLCCSAYNATERTMYGPSLGCCICNFAHVFASSAVPT